MLSYSPSSKTRAEAELELRRRRRARQVALRALPIADFAARTKIEVPVGANETALTPFRLWPEQRRVVEAMDRERLLAILKARQLGISWLACLYALRLCTLWPGQPILALSRGQLEADELVHRISVMHHEHSDQAQTLPRLVKDNTADLEWDNGSTVVSLAATKNAGRSLTAALVILDEWAFMAWPRETLAAVKPTIDAGGKLWIISSADGLGSEYHQHWLAAERGANGYAPIFLPWTARPDRGPGWRDQKLVESLGDTATVYREYPANPIEAFTHAAGLVYDVWSDGPADGNVTEAADYEEGAGPILWGIDDGYAGARDKATGLFTADSHPRVFGLYQRRHDGAVCRFAESYEVRKLSDQHLADVLQLPYPRPDYAVVDKSAAELKGRLHAAQIYTRNGPADVAESIKELRRAVAADANGRRRLLVHPRCAHFRAEMASYRYDQQTGKPVKQFDHGPDEARYLMWALRYEA
jgi:hypothetical protein